MRGRSRRGRDSVAAQRGAVGEAPGGAGIGPGAGLLLVEHPNLNVLSTEVALRFYEALGCARNAGRPMGKTLHSTCGYLTQFHTPSPENEAYIAEGGPGSGAQRWRGEIELLYESQASLDEALARVRGLLGDSLFQSSALSTGTTRGGEVSVTCPYGNEFCLRVASPDRRAALGPDAGRQPYSEHSRCVGIGALTLQVPVGSAAPGARFYEQALGFRTQELRPGEWAVLGGPRGDSQRLVLRDTPGATGKEVGEHVAIYVGDFEGCFLRLLSRGLVWVNPRFKHLDATTTLEEARKDHCFRFREVVDAESGAALFELEHEVRSTSHRSCPLHPPKS